MRRAPGLLGDEVEVERRRRGHARRSASAASAGMMPELGPGPRPARARMSSQLCSRARSSKSSRSSGVPHRWAYCSRVAQAGAHVGSHVGGQRRQRLGDLGQRCPPRHDDPAVVDLDVPSRAGSTWSAAAAGATATRFRGQMSTCVGALAVEPLVDLLRALAADQRPRPGARGARPGSRCVAPSTVDAAAAARQQVAARRPGPRPASSSSTTSGTSSIGGRSSVDVEHPPRLVEQLRPDTAARPRGPSPAAGAGSTMKLTCP